MIYFKWGRGEGGEIISMSVQIDANITLVLREQDVSLLLKAMGKYTPENEKEIRGREYLLDVLEQVALPEDTRNQIFSTQFLSF
jgi:hypothetical protein